MAPAFYPNYQFPSSSEVSAGTAPAPSSGLTPDAYQQLLGTIQGLEVKLQEQSELVGLLSSPAQVTPLPQTPETTRDSRLGVSKCTHQI